MAKKYWVDNSYYYTISKDGKICWLHQTDNCMFPTDECLACTLLFNDDIDKTPASILFLSLKAENNLN